MAELTATLNVGEEVLALVEKKIAARQTEIDELKRERDEARRVACQLLHIAKVHGARPFGTSMFPWLKDEG